MTHRGILVVRAWKDISEILVKALFVNQILVKIVEHVMSIKAGLEMIIKNIFQKGHKSVRHTSVTLTHHFAQTSVRTTFRILQTLAK